MDTHMEYRQLGGSGLSVPVLTLGTLSFGSNNEFFKHWGTVASSSTRSMLSRPRQAGRCRRSP
jgi:aryl-alcohol dehydrogenase-like predicted oxidoreductase